LSSWKSLMRTVAQQIPSLADDARDVLGQRVIMSRDIALFVERNHSVLEQHPRN
jgi:hypothetical protein